MVTTITGIQPDMAVSPRIVDTPDTEAGRDDGAAITEAMMVRAEGVEEAIMVVLVEVAEVVGEAVIADRQYSRH